MSKVWTAELNSVQLGTECCLKDSLFSLDRQSWDPDVESCPKNVSAPVLPADSVVLY